MGETAMESRFNLAEALATWRQFQTQSHQFLEKDLDELEVHLRTHIAELQREGWSKEAAFREAVRALGDMEEIETEYCKVHWGKLKRERKLGDELNWRLTMFKNYFTVALRAMRKQVGYAFINVVGLSAGLTCFVLIMLFVQHELSYDRFYGQADRIHRIIKRHPGSTMFGSEYWALTPPQIAPVLTTEYPEIEAATTVDDHTGLLSYDDKYVLEEGWAADASFFEVFGLSLLIGDQQTALKDPDSIVLTASLAQKLFGDENPVGETLLFKQAASFKVTGVIADLPENSSFQYSFITSIASKEDYKAYVTDDSWSSSFFTFVRLEEEASVDQLQGQMADFVNRYVPGASDAAPSQRVQYLIQPLNQIHLRPGLNFDIAATGGKNNVYIFATIGIIILLLACVNYANLAVVRSVKRAREVGMRKVVGALRGQLAGQFLSESVLLAVIALSIAVVAAHFLAPYFGYLVERPIEMDYLGNPFLVPGLLALIGIVGVMAGSYPALFMASLKPIEILKGRLSSRSTQSILQPVLIVVQFTVCIALVAGSFIAREQMQFVQQKDLGYDREHIVTMPVQDASIIEDLEALRRTWHENPQIVSVSGSSALPTQIRTNNQIADASSGMEGEGLGAYVAYTDYDYLDVFGIDLAVGRGFSREISSDQFGAVLLNSKAVTMIGWSAEDALGQRIVHNGQNLTVIGVVNDFHMHSMHIPIEPLIMRLDPSLSNYISVKLRPENLTETLTFLEESRSRFTSYPFVYHFLDEEFDRLYKNELRLGETLSFFTVIAFIIAGLGLFGLAAFFAEQRTKEIGVRKALGASTGNIVMMLTKNLASLVIIASIIASPVAFFFMRNWLQGFAYRIEIGPWIFIATCAVTLVIALLSVGFQTLRAAMVNPVKSLRYD